ncbi:MAG: hypothetical protein L0229_09150 [Blastocatellia bacterium]|nr:hypothetical protein [Blastocatellia bacterium]
MTTDRLSPEEIFAQVQNLSPGERLRLLKQVIDTLVPAEPPAHHQPLIYGQFHGAGMSTDDDFRIAEWKPSEKGV